jgi:hypothetical protein
MIRRRKPYDRAPVANPGTLVFIDSFSGGLIPARIRSAWRTAGGTLAIDTVLTATRGIYRRGETWCDADAGRANGTIIPRPAVYRSRQHCGQYRVLPFRWELAVSEDDLQLERRLTGPAASWDPR